MFVVYGLTKILVVNQLKTIFIPESLSYSPNAMFMTLTSSLGLLLGNPLLCAVVAQL